jgi:hypothetical protein
MSRSRILVVVGIILIPLCGPARAQPAVHASPASVALTCGRVCAGSAGTGNGLLEAALRESNRLGHSRPASLATSHRHAAAETNAGGRRSWVSRHPVLFGAIIGGVAGSVALGLTDSVSGHPEPGEAYSMGFGLGAGVGALVGLLTH